MTRMYTVNPRHAQAALSCRTIAEQVGMSFVEGPDGFDSAIVDLAERVMFDREDILHRPSRVAGEITAYLDDIARNP